VHQLVKIVRIEGLLAEFGDDLLLANPSTEFGGLRRG